jgi:hypothetical protein
VNDALDLTFVPGAASLGAFWDPIAERLPASWMKRCLDLPGQEPHALNPSRVRRAPASRG